MKKTALFTALIAASTLASTAATAKDWSKPSFYGEVEINILMSNHRAYSSNFDKSKVDLSAKNETKVNTVDMQSQGAKFGAKGSGELMDGVEGIYQMGIKYDSVVGGDFKTDTTFLGLKGGFGEVKMGKFDTPMKDLSVGEFGHVGTDFSKNGHTPGKITQYTTPDLGGVKAKLAMIPYQGAHIAEDKTNGNEPYATNNGNGLSTSVVFEQDGILVGAAYDRNVADKGKNPGKDINGVRLVGQIDLDGIELGAMYDMNSVTARTNGAKSIDMNSIVLSAAMSMDKLTPRVSVAIASGKDNGTEYETSGLSVVAGADYAFNDGAKAYANLGHTSYGTKAKGDKEKTDSAMQAEVGLEYKF